MGPWYPPHTHRGEQTSRCTPPKTPLRRMTVPTPRRLRIHHVHVVVVVVVVDHRDRLLPAHVLAAHGTRALAPQPRPDTLEVEAVAALARQLDDETPLVLEVRHLADGAVVVGGERLAADAVERVDKLLARAAQRRGRIVDVGLERGHELVEEVAVVGRGRRRRQRLQLVLQQAEEGGGVDGRGRGVRVVVGGLRARGLAELVEEGEEGGHVDAARGAPGLREPDVVLDWARRRSAAVLLGIWGGHDLPSYWVAMAGEGAAAGPAASFGGGWRCAAADEGVQWSGDALQVASRRRRLEQAAVSSQAGKDSRRGSRHGATVGRSLPAQRVAARIIRLRLGRPRVLADFASKLFYKEQYELQCKIQCKMQREMQRKVPRNMRAMPTRRSVAPACQSDVVSLLEQQIAELPESRSPPSASCPQLLYRAQSIYSSAPRNRALRN
ncbi:Uncharacterized protein TCAP_06735 [Tolypocladium capitatum]|uniref:Uncharacterized protein n=1 Tax=Tolypocladium capitatum TaxID=45235 RepID=A0A2K3Q6X9_9HYPO|nr:Uncharacterized protein TCAP_06735 [Tolypocladium capitatum]